MVELVRRNLRISVRKLRKNLTLSLVIMLTLALGIGANTAIFSVCYAVFLAPLPYPHPGQLVVLQSKIQGHDDWVSTQDFIDWKQQNILFQDLNAWTGGGFNTGCGKSRKPLQTYPPWLKPEFSCSMFKRV